MSSPAPYGRPPLRTVQVLGGVSAGSSGQVRALATGLTARGVRVTVCSPQRTEEAHDFTGAGAVHVPVPRRGDPASLAALRAACSGADLVHAHGPHAALRASLALSGRPVPLVVTWYSGGSWDGSRPRVRELVERRVARAASVVLGATPELVGRARALGARDARLAVLAHPGARPPHEGDTAGRSTADPDKTRAELGAVGRSLLLAVGALHAGRGYRTLLDAARAWRGLEPQPLVLIAGEGPLRSQLQRRIRREDLPVRLLGRRTDVPELLGAADLVLVPGSREARSVLAQEALLAGVPLVAAEVGMMTELVGGAAELVPHGDAEALARAVTALLDDPYRRQRLRVASRALTRGWPSEDEAAAQVLGVYDELTG
ncbi:glycosyl transferase [Streptomyces albus]|uniref:D-inositol 3-phosphate glycosyltransferase n=1 Tax=Streptomyces albus (strain ATCC 21838 / DSM 41398 / FERM P-419 / JCM 4703 / NBRC 107858) TaxID=1081613 RepID=A0A0B5F6G6_STRA4|nr:glycosyl transferase [Streptomyces albus]AOU80779.1 glycosyl transferase [Streptomyces albus]